MRVFILNIVLGFWVLAAQSSPGPARAAEPTRRDDVAPFVGGLWLVQQHGTPDALDPRNDVRTKGVIGRAVTKDGKLVVQKLKSVLDDPGIAALGGADAQLAPTEIHRLLETNAPATRKRLLPRVAAHLELLTTSLDCIDEPHRAAGEQLTTWIASKYKPGQPLEVVVVCTGNSRRSILAATLGNASAAYYGLPEIRFSSGGTAPTAFNSRTAAALKAIGVEVDATGVEAPRGDPATANPKFRIRWGDGGTDIGTALETTEFSKHYSDASNPQNGFAALMVCSEADEGCPFVKGASLRLSMPYLDPKLYDGSPFESAKYAERRDDIGRLMLSVMLRARRQLLLAGKLP